MTKEDARPLDARGAAHPGERGEDGREAAPQVHVRSEATCPLCLEPLTALPRLEVCGGCRTIHHAGCVDEFGRCGTPGCRGLTRAASATSAGADGGLEENERAIAAVAHLGNIVGAAIILPLVLYFMTRHKQAFAAHHAWRALVFSLLSIPLSIVTLGLWVPVMFVLTIRAAYRAWRGEWVPYGRREPASPPAPSRRDPAPAKG